MAVREIESRRTAQFWQTRSMNNDKRFQGDMEMSESALRAQGAATGGIKILLRCEGLALFLAACAAYDLWGGPRWLFVVLFLAPDLSFLAYLISRRKGAIVYNAVHTTIAPIVLAGVGSALSMPLLTSIAIIWLAHIGLDRAFGYGLKYQAGFGFTHLGRVGRS
jgi:hypothetical protein